MKAEPLEVPEDHAGEVAPVVRKMVAGRAGQHIRLEVILNTGDVHVPERFAIRIQRAEDMMLIWFGPRSGVGVKTSCLNPAVTFPSHTCVGIQIMRPGSM